MVSRTPNFDAKVKAILDATKPGERVCAATGEKWMMDERELAICRRFNVPPSKLSPTARMKLIGGYFVVFNMWYNQHAETGKPLLSTTHPATGIRVLPDREWFEKDFIEKGRSVDIDRPFYEQLYLLSRDVPLAASYNYVMPENSIAFISLGDQDSCFVLACRSKRTCYAMNAIDVEDSAELALVHGVRESYAIVHSEQIYKCKFVHESFACMNSAFLFDCRNCENCFGATNQRNKKYLWFNEQLSREEWEKRFASVDLSSFATRQEYEQRFEELMQTAIWPENLNSQTEACTGEYISNATSVRDGYFVTSGCRDLDAVSFAFVSPSHDCATCVAAIGSSDCYYGIGQKDSSKVLFSLSIVERCSDVEFCNSCYDCEFCFGCVGLRRKKFCILNKQYTEDEYWQKLDAIKCAMLDREEYGDLPPMHFSTQHWSGSGAVAIYGSTEDECRKLGAANLDPGAEGAEGPPVDPSLLQSTATIPNRVDSIEDLIGKPFMDDVFGRRFGYLRPELELYKKLGIAPPRKHPTRRINELFAQMNYAQFEDTKCEKCHADIRVAKNRRYPQRTVYCKACYHQFLETR